MKSYTTGRNLAGVWTKNSTAANLSYLDQTANDAYRHICAMKDWPFLEAARTLTSVAGTQFIALPYDCSQVREIAVVPTGSTTRYVPKLSPSREHWDQLNLSVVSSNIPEWYFVFAGKLGLWPTPVSAGNTIFVHQKCRVIDLQFADYTTGTITTAASVAGLTTLTGSGTTFTAQMVGRQIQIAGTGDLEWYEIGGFVSTTAITLVRTISADFATQTNALTIGQMGLLPEDFQDTPWKKASQIYWEKEADKRSASFMNGYNADILDLIHTWSAATTDMVIEDGREARIINPNLTINL